MFNKRIKQELSALREELSSVQQVKDNLESEMLCMSLDPNGLIESVNGNFLQEMHYQTSQLLGRPVEALIPAFLMSDEHHLRFINALKRGEHYSGTVPVCTGVTGAKLGCAQSCSRCVTLTAEF